MFYPKVVNSSGPIIPALTGSLPLYRNNKSYGIQNFVGSTNILTQRVHMKEYCTLTA